jgi:hypothetical protein
MRDGDFEHSGSGISLLKNGIYERQMELHNLADVLSEHAQKLGKTGGIGRVLIIILGAFVATQGVSETIFESENHAALITYTICGLLIAALSGIEAAFKTESRSAELKLLAATCQSTIWKTDSEWQKSIGSGLAENPTLAARNLLDTQDQVLADIHIRAAQLGINITHEVRELWGGEPRAAA